MVLLYGSMYDDVGAIINISGRFTLRDGLEQYLGKNFMERIKRDGYLDLKKENGNAESVCILFAVIVVYMFALSPDSVLFFLPVLGIESELSWKTICFLNTIYLNFLHLFFSFEQCNSLNPKVEKFTG